LTASIFGWPIAFGSTVTKLRASDGSVVGIFTAGSSPQFLAFDGANLWVSNVGSNTVTKLRALDGSVLGTFPEAQRHGLAFDGANIWVTNTDNSVVSKL
jgi:DNA-binding beta-propeller fold protein YncE